MQACIIRIIYLLVIYIYIIFIIYLAGARSLPKRAGATSTGDIVVKPLQHICIYYNYLIIIITYMYIIN